MHDLLQTEHIGTGRPEIGQQPNGERAAPGIERGCAWELQGKAAKLDTPCPKGRVEGDGRTQSGDKLSLKWPASVSSSREDHITHCPMPERFRPSAKVK